MITIYKLIFPNGKIYIGQTCNFKKRMNDHRYTAKSHVLYNIILYRAIRKYKWENIKKEILCICCNKKSDDKEKFYIKKFKSNNCIFGYNLDSGGNKNKKHSKISVEKMRKAKLGKHLSTETKIKISQNHGMLHKTGKLCCNSKAVYQIDLKGKIIKKWESATEAEKYFDLKTGSISSACRGETCSMVDFIWIYANDYSEIYLNKKLTLYNKRYSSLNKPIYQLTLDGKIIKKWISAKEAFDRLHINNISACANNKRFSSGGFRWEFCSL